MDVRTRYETLDEAIQSAVEAKLAETHTAIPGKIVSVDFAKQTCVMQPTVKARVHRPDGTQDWVDLPQIPDVPLHFPSGGGVTLTFPVKEGDEGLIVFSGRTQDAWQQQGGDQQQVDLRPHDASNAFAMVGFKSNPKALSGVSSSSTQIRSDDGTQVIDIHPANGLTLTSGGVSMAMTPAGVAFTGGTISHNGQNIGSTHVHGGIQPGAADTGTPH